MFSGCTNFYYPPSLEATTVKLMGCYNTFYSNPLYYAPAVTVKNITSSSFHQTFYNNTSITRCYLPFVTLAPSGCYGLFYNCSNLKSLVVKITAWTYGDNHSTYNWVQGVSNTGEFYCPTTLPSTDDYKNTSHIPVNWTVKNNTKTSNLEFRDTISTGSMKLFYLTK